MQDAHAARPTLFVGVDEFLETALEPGCHHAAVGVPDCAETIPQARVAPHRPIFHELTDDAFVVVDAHWVTGFAGEGGEVMAESGGRSDTASESKLDQISRPSTFSRNVLTVSAKSRRCGSIASAAW